MTFPHLHEQVKRQFGYIQTIPRHLVVFAPPAMTQRDMNDMFDEYLSRLVLEEARSIITERDWSYVDRYIRWLFRVSHMFMVRVALGDPLRPTHQEILEEE